eukprot:8147877-Lingulodinium_polyedra.AAC.1
MRGASARQHPRNARATVPQRRGGRDGNTARRGSGQFPLRASEPDYPHERRTYRHTARARPGT